MFAAFSLFPEQASTTAPRVDDLFFFLLAVTGVVGLAVTLLIIFFAVRYRRRAEDQRTPRILGSTRLELFWTITPLFIFLVMFLWGASVYTDAARPPDDALEVYVVGKQWMWKLQHVPDGQREINELHVPVGRPVKLTMTSEDVVHGFAVPAFRVQVDVVPGRFHTLWFEATKEGQYHLFCAQYCGTQHAGMVGTVHVLKEADYARWLQERAEGAPALEGRKLFQKLECASCHTGDEHARAPNLKGLYRKPVRVRLPDGRAETVVADEAYLRESILYPAAKVVEPWEPIMPTYKGQLADKDVGEAEALVQLIAYLRSPSFEQPVPRTQDFPPPDRRLSLPGTRNEGP